MPISLFVGEAPASILATLQEAVAASNDPGMTMLSCCAQVTSLLQGYPYYSDVERAGRTYEERLYRQRQGDTGDASALDGKTAAEQDAAEEEEEDSSVDAEMKRKAEAKKRQKKQAALEKEDFYELLGLGQQRYEATQDQIRKAYREQAMIHHPDKNETRDDTMFKAIQKAWEVLGNDKSRRAYDSAEDFDEQIPQAGSFTEERFYEVFGPVFQRWAKWSVYKPVPKLGDEATQYAQVEQFYKFWQTFQSWRDFSYDDEYDPNTAEYREERRWMERQNDKRRAKQKKEERDKLVKLVQLAQKSDPRVRRHKERVDAEILRKQREKDEAARRRKEEREKKIADELKREEDQKRAEEEEQKRKKLEQQQNAKELNELKERLRTIVRPYLVFAGSSSKSSSAASDKDSTQVRGEDLEFAMLRLTKVEQMREFVKRLDDLRTSEQEGDAAAKKVVQCFNATVKKIRDLDKKKAEEASAAADGADGSAGAAGSAGEWTTEELALLTKAVSMYPGGSAKRWEKIAEYIRTKTPDEVRAKTAEVKKLNVLQGSVPKSDSFAEWQRFKKTQETAKKRDAETDGVDGTSSAAAAKKPVEDWTSDQQKQLEAGIRQCKDIKDATTKWAEISKLVPGKSAQDCRDRFDYCKKLALEKRAAAGK